jgi:hypothetical protein
VVSLPLLAKGEAISGRVIHPSRPEAGAGIELQLLGVSRSGQSVERTTKADSKGSFTFEDLPGNTAYLLAASYDGLSFPGGNVIFEPGQPPTRSVVFHIYDRTDDPHSAQVASLRLLIEREAGSYRVQHSLFVSNPTLKVLAIAPDAPPLFRVALPAHEGPISVPFGRMPEGAHLENGNVLIRGPILPGTHNFTFAYELPASGDRLETEVSLAEAVPQLEVLIRDFGVRIDAGQLHPARPSREKDSIYLRYVGFDLPAGTRLPLRVEPLRPTMTPPPWLQVLMVMVLAGGLLFVVYQPIERAALATPEAAEASLDEHEAIASSLRDLEFDYETGKLSEADRDGLREELRREGARTLARSRRRRKTAQPEPSRACSCGRAPEPGDRFCASCGKAL